MWSYVAATAAALASVCVCGAIVVWLRLVRFARFRRRRRCRQSPTGSARHLLYEATFPRRAAFCGSQSLSLPPITLETQRESAAHCHTLTDKRQPPSVG